MMSDSPKFYMPWYDATLIERNKDRGIATFDSFSLMGEGEDEGGNSFSEINPPLEKKVRGI